MFCLINKYIPTFKYPLIFKFHNIKKREKKKINTYKNIGISII